MLRNTTIEVEKNESMLSYWRKVKMIVKGDGTEAFTTLNKFVAHIFTLAHSSACVERVFSAINLNKTKIRNRLGVDTLSDILHTKAALKRQDKSCFKIRPKMVASHSNDMY